MKKAQFFLRIFYIPVDFLISVFCFIEVYNIREQKESFLFFKLFHEGYIPPINEYLIFVFFISLLLVIVFSFGGVYSTNYYKKDIKKIHRNFILITIWLFIISSYFFWIRSFFFSRFVLIFGSLLTFLLTSLIRIIIDFIRGLKIFKDSFKKEIVLVGVSALNNKIIQKINNDGEYRITQMFITEENKKISNIKTYITKNKVYEIIQTDVGNNKEFDLKILDYCQVDNICYHFIPGVIDLRSNLVEIRSLSKIPLISLKQTPLDGWGRFFKRFFDVCFSLVALIVVSPIILLTTIVIKLTSKGDVFVSLKRVRLRDVFCMYKFRSMITGAHAMKKDLISKNERKDGPLFKIEKDPRITKIGKFLRKTRIDEIPQFWNVLIGDMSIVGPRPHEPEEVSKYKKHHRKLLAIKPGITGMAQVNGASDLLFEEEVDLDTFYIENWSMLLDVKIIFKTVWVVVFGKGAA